ncbi:hypothetical protein F0L17_11850 [Streptomyces sp. TRM43335]|uniref:Uncharacterized protein n=1 Tax=Streptomyces taklimakanensis TaxID=2569853 RepID=A0A6G2BC00_9ACTN|nr:DUF6274 family protein [Streptomyces taklimakanensis]MTE19797.1 hypothetical protein [Streptomyces taklimakanensis]
MPTTPKGPRHETRALLRAHLSAATRYGHVTRHCPICHRLQRLAMEAGDELRPGPRPVVSTGVNEPPGPGSPSDSPAAPSTVALSAAPCPEPRAGA